MIELRFERQNVSASHSFSPGIFAKDGPADRDGRRIWPENLDFVRLPATVVGSVPANRRTAAFPPRAFMDPGSLKSGWWCGQSGANPSPPNFDRVAGPLAPVGPQVSEAI